MFLLISCGGLIAAPVRCCSGILPFQELLYPLFGNAEVEVVRSAELCKVHGHEVAVFVYYGASARTLQRRQFLAFVKP